MVIDGDTGRPAATGCAAIETPRGDTGTAVVVDLGDTITVVLGDIARRGDVPNRLTWSIWVTLCWRIGDIIRVTLDVVLVAGGMACSSGALDAAGSNTLAPADRACKTLALEGVACRECCGLLGEVERPCGSRIEPLGDPINNAACTDNGMAAVCCVPPAVGIPGATVMDGTVLG